MSNDPNTKNNKNSNLFDYSLDTVLNKEYDEFNKKINKNTKIMVLANTVLCIGIFQYFKRYHRSLFDKNRGIMRNFMSVLFHSFGSVFLIVLINGLLLGITPHNIKKKRDLENRLIYQSNYNLNYDLIKDIFHDEEEKIKISNDKDKKTENIKIKEQGKFIF